MNRLPHPVMTGLASFKRSGAVKLIVTLLSAMAVTAISGCASMPSLSPAANYELPAVENPDTAASIHIASAHNPTDVQFVHLLKLDGKTIMELRESDKRRFALDAGTYTVEATCHAVPPDDSAFPINYSVADGRARIELAVETGEDYCLRISKPILTCVALEDSVMSMCE